jgi:N-acetylmuramoyl-L-alanine amidase
VFVLSETGASSAAARWLAKRENDADLIGGVRPETRGVILERTIYDLQQDRSRNESVKLAGMVLGELSQLNRLHRNGVEFAGFAVLKSHDIPSILVETAFISNPVEERKLARPGAPGSVGARHPLRHQALPATEPGAGTRRDRLTRLVPAAQPA